MSYLVQASNAFSDFCTLLAGGIRTGSDGISYVIRLNYNFVAAGCNFAYTTASAISVGATQAWNAANGVLGSICDFVYEFKDSVVSIGCAVGRGFVNVYNVIDSICVTVFNFITSSAHLISQSYLTMRQTVVDVYGGIAYLCHFVLNTFITTVTTTFNFLTSIGSCSVNFVVGVWQGLGFVLSSVAYFPVYCAESVESVKQRVTDFVVHAFTVTPKETYLGIVCLCILYFMLSNTFRYLTCHGLPLFSTRLARRRRRRRGQGLDWHFDRGFESDFEDLFNSDTEDRMWGNDQNTVIYSNESDNDESEEDEDSNDSGTVDNDLSDVDDEGDEDDSDENTIMSEDSDSDASLNSQTFSTESSDHDIEIQLPTREERYSLRSRSSTPSRLPKPLNNPEDFDREMERERDKRKCVVCTDQIKSVLVLPCRHMCMCVDCADRIVQLRPVSRRVCPLCRTRIQKVMNIYV